MACLTEAMGMSLPGCGTALAVSAKKKRIAFESGERIVELVKRNITARKILNYNAIYNAIVMDNALGGSTNTVLHIPAIAHEAGVDIRLELFDEVSKKIPHITNLRPAGEYFMEDFEYAGGVQGAMHVLKNKLKNNQTISGKSIKLLAAEGKVYDHDIIRPLSHPHHKEGGMAVLKGNLAPNGCVVKQSAVSPKAMKFKGKAVVFESEEQAMKAILARKIKAGMVVVVRYEGPRGGPGMREMLAPTAAIAGMVPLPGSPIPNASVRQFIELAVKSPAQEPQPGQAASSSASNSSALIRPAWCSPTASKRLFRSTS